MIAWSNHKLNINFLIIYIVSLVGFISIDLFFIFYRLDIQLVYVLEQLKIFYNGLASVNSQS